MFLSVIVASLFTVVILILFKLEKDSTRWSRIATLIQTVAVVWALAFAVYSIESANEGTDKTVKEIGRLFNASTELSTQFEKLSSNMSTMPAQLEKFSNKIAELDSTVDKQQHNLSSALNDFKNNISDFNQSLSTYRNSVSDYSSQLSKIVRATDSQLVIWKEQQAIVKKEYSRRPILYLEPARCIQSDSTVTIEGIIVVNTGDIEARLDAIILFVNTKDVVDVDNIVTRRSKTEKGTDFFQINLGNLSPSNLVAQHERAGVQEFRITLRVNKELIKTVGLPYSISYSIRYESRYSSEPFDGLLYCKQ